MLRNIVKKNRTVDSLSLMLLTNRFKAMEGIEAIAAMMGADGNKGILAEGGLLAEEGRAATPADLIIAIRADSEATIRKVLEEIEQALEQKDPRSDDDYRPRTLEGAKGANTNLMFCSLPGPYVRWEVRKALEAGLHCMIFSEDVPSETERELKTMAHEKGLLVMGPACPTALISGVALGFANVVNRGRIGIVGTSGTGIQEVSVQLHQLGEGISHALGTGERDLSEAIGGLSMFDGIDLLEGDPQTELLLLIVPPLAPSLEEKLLGRVSHLKKPAVLCFLGGSLDEAQKYHLSAVRTLEEAAQLAIATLRNRPFEPNPFSLPRGEVTGIVQREMGKLSPQARFLRGLFAGKALADEALVLLEDKLPLHSNRSRGMKLKNSQVSEGNTIVSLGEDPLIDYTPRMQRLVEEAHDPEVGVFLFDVVLGYAAHPHPAEALLPAIEEARADHPLAFVASLCGTDGDPQGFRNIREALENAGVLLMPSNAQAARLAAMIALREPALF